jgi:hypothetical protein
MAVIYLFMDNIPNTTPFVLQFSGENRVCAELSQKRAQAILQAIV